MVALGAGGAFFAALSDLKVGIAVGICDSYKFFDVDLADSPAMCAKSPLTGAELTWVVPGFAFVLVCALAYFIFRPKPGNNEEPDNHSAQAIQEQIEVLRTQRDAGQLSDENAERLDRLEDVIATRAIEALESAHGIDVPTDRQTEDTSNARREAVKEAIEDGDTDEREAMALIADGDIQGGLSLLESEANVASTEALEMWRRIGRIADGIDTTRALNAFTKVAALGSDDIWDSIYFGRLQVRAGDLMAAKATIENAFEALPEKERRDRSVLHHDLGNILLTLGDLAGARQSYEAGLEIAEALAASDPTNAAWQRDLSISHNKIGDVFRLEGNLEGARESYEVALNIREALAASDPANVEWQRNLCVSHNKIGDVLLSGGKVKGARESYEAALEISEALAASDPANVEWQRDLSVSHNKIGGVFRSEGNLEGARKSYEADLKIAEALAASDPTNVEWQRDLAVSHERIADIAMDQQDFEKASMSFEKALAIYDTLTKKYPDHLEIRVFSVVPRWHLGKLYKGEDAQKMLVDALNILTPLADDGKLDARREDWIPEIRAELKKLG